MLFKKKLIIDAGEPPWPGRSLSGPSFGDLSRAGRRPASPAAGGG